MIGLEVTHPVYGSGQVVGVYRNGTEWMVRFSNGFRFRRPRSEFDGQEPVRILPAAPSFTPVPMPETQFEARQLLEALRVGIAPAQHVRALTIGLKAEQERLHAGLVQAHQSGGCALAVMGEYGYGKSHIVELTAQEALQRNFLVATTSLDLQERPPHRSFAIYSDLMRNLRYPNTDERGIGPLMEACADAPRLLDQLRKKTTQPHDPLAVALEVLTQTASRQQQALWQRWLMGARRSRLMNRAMPRGVRFPSIYTIGHNARQIAYLLSGISVLARLAHYSGLCILIDEAESYSLLRSRQRPKAGLFFQAMLYAVLQDQQSHIAPDMLPQHRYRDYPPAYDAGQSLFFLFTVTRSDRQMPLDEWLDEDRILILDPHFTPKEIGQFLEQVMHYHAQAYGYEPGERHRQVRRAAAEHLAAGVRSDRLSIRGTVRLGVELFDLLHLHPDYEPATLLDEVREQMR